MVKRWDAPTVLKSCPPWQILSAAHGDVTKVTVHPCLSGDPAFLALLESTKNVQILPWKRREMRNWFLPVTVLGLSGLGLVFASKRGRERVLTFLDRMVEHGDPLGEFNKLCEEQLNTIQSGLDRLAEVLKESEA
jgi:hypothetical protein